MAKELKTKHKINCDFYHASLTEQKKNKIHIVVILINSIMEKNSKLSNWAHGPEDDVQIVCDINDFNL